MIDFKAWLPLVIAPLFAFANFAAAQDQTELKAGIIGLDTSHSLAFTKILNDETTKGYIPGCKVVIAYPYGSRDIESSTSRIPDYTEKMKAMSVEIAPSIEKLLEKVDVVFLETNDGRPHLEQARLVIAAGKPLFIDKPITASLKDAVTIFEEAKAANVPVFSSSSLRFAPTTLAARNGEMGTVLGCDAYSPASLEATHPDLFWYGIHGVETLFTVMGTGCESVVRLSTDDTDLVAGTWKDGRIGTFRGMRAGKRGYGGTVYTDKAIASVGDYGGYQPLVVEIVKFFRTHEPPVSPRETLEIYAFMEAADVSKKNGGVPVSIAEVLKKAGYTE